MKATDSYLRAASDSICAKQKTLHRLYLRPRQNEIKTSLLSYRD